MTDTHLAFVQFPHPRREHVPPTGDFMDWNRDDHARKFMASSGRYVTRERAGDGWTNGKGNLVFWGEWEAQSAVERPFNKVEPWYPQVLHKPVLGPAPADFHQNTDPFVFGDRMRYTICRQYRTDKDERVLLRQLAPGSVILFGSTAEGSFILDTVLVVGSEKTVWTPQEVPESTKKMTDPVHHKATIEPVARWEMFKNRPHRSFTFYNGVTYAERDEFGGMFSFVPCQVQKDSPRGFKRPHIKLDGIINPRSSRTARYNIPEVGGVREKIVDLWEHVVTQAIEQGCNLGHTIELPKIDYAFGGSEPRKNGNRSNGC